MHKLFQGAYDLHVHSGPDIVPRKADDPEMCQRFLAADFRGYCIKSHYFCTAERARTMRHYFPQLNVIGSISLNRTVGGMNAQAVDAAGRDGAKVVWFPTFDSKNEINFTFGENCTYDTMPAWALRMKERREKGIIDAGITVIDETGALTQETEDVMSAIAEHDMILCTGHLAPQEIFAVVRRAPQLGVKRLVITHATWASVGLKKEEQRALSDLGAMIEVCSANMKAAYGVTWEEMYEILRFVGPENCILSSDAGNRNKPYPVESLEAFAENLLAHGFTEQELRSMAVENTTRLVEE